MVLGPATRASFYALEYLGRSRLSMGGGGLRILPHKSWNVYNFDNRERVRKDEATAQAEADQRHRRAEEADQERRLETLRARARVHRPATPSPEPAEDQAALLCPADACYAPLVRPGSSSTAANPAKHINFFEDVERRGSRAGPNSTRQREAKEELEREHKRLGVLTYLGQTVTDERKAGRVPWWQQASHAPAGEAGVSSAKQARRAMTQDPLVAMKGFLTEKTKHDRSHRQLQSETADAVQRAQRLAQMTHAPMVEEAQGQVARLLMQTSKRISPDPDAKDVPESGAHRHKRRRTRDDSHEEKYKEKHKKIKKHKEKHRHHDY